MNVEELLAKYRRIMDKIHEQSNIYYDKNQMDAYIVVAKMASDIRVVYARDRYRA